MKFIGLTKDSNGMTYCGWSIQDNNVIIKFTLDYFDETELDSITIPIDEFLEKCKEL